MRIVGRGRAKSARGATDVHPRTLALLFCGLLGAALVPVLTHPLPPLGDYLNHLARSDVISEIETDPDLARYYIIDWKIIPNLMMDLIVPLLERFMGIYLAGQIFTALAFVLILSGTFALNRALIGRWTAAPLIAVPLLYNGVLLVGVMNYIFGIGVVLWALAAWVYLRDRPVRFAVSVLFVLVVYLTHLFAAGIYALGVFALELHRLWAKRGEPLRPRLIDFVASGLPFALIPVLLFASATLDTPGHEAHWEWPGKIHGLVLAVTVYYESIGYALVAAVALAAAYGWTRGILGWHPAGWAILAVGVVTYLALPRALLAAHLADQRLPIALGFVLIACVDLNLRERVLRHAFAVFAVILAVVRVSEVQAVWTAASPNLAAFFESVRSIRPGSRVVVALGDRDKVDWITAASLWHAASLATIERSALVSTNFSVPGKHVLRVRSEFREMVDTEDRWPPLLDYFVKVAERPLPNVSYYCDRWARNYDYAYILYTVPGMPNPAERYLTLEFEGPGFQLYRVKRAS